MFRLSHLILKKQPCDKGGKAVILVPIHLSSLNKYLMSTRDVPNPELCVRIIEVKDRALALQECSV